MKKWIQKIDWRLVAVILIFFLLPLIKASVEYSFEQRMMSEQVLDLKLYLLNMLFSIIINGIILGMDIGMAAFMVFMLVSLCCGTKMKGKKFGEAVGRLVSFLVTPLGVGIVVAGLIGCALILPGEDIREYRIEDKRVPPITAIFRLLQDMNAEPEVVLLEDIEATLYNYQHSGYRTSGSHHQVSYARYERDGKVYETPTTTYFYRQLISLDLLDEKSVEVLIYPHTGIVVDFVEKPISLCSTDEERIERCKEKFGPIYLLKADEQGRIEIITNTEVPTSLFAHYRSLLDYEAFWVSYNGKEPYECYLSSASTKGYVAMESDGTYEIRVGKKNGLILSDCLTFVVKDGFVESINGVVSGIEVYDPIKPAAEDEQYSAEMAHFIELAKESGYQVDTETYHYIFERDKRYFEYKYVSAFFGNLRSSIQVYECATEEEAVLTYESWIETYGTESMENEERKVYALRGNAVSADNGILLRQGNFVYIFWDDNVGEAEETAEFFGVDGINS